MRIVHCLVLSLAVLALACGGGQTKSAEPAKEPAAEAEAAEAKPAAKPAMAADAAKPAAEPAAEPETATEASQEPEWWERTQFFQDTGDSVGICGVGAGTVRMPTMARNQAQTRARAELMKFLEVTVTEIEQAGVITVKERAGGTLQGTRILMTQVVEGTTYALACIDLPTLRAQPPWNGQPELVDAIEARGKKALGK